MKYCRQCKIKSLDTMNRCPLCESLLEDLDQETNETRYPELSDYKTGYNLVKKIYMFFSVMIIAASIIVDFQFKEGITWSVLSIGAVLYSWTVLYHAIRNNVHMASKILVQAIAGSVFIFIIDEMIGFRGWSVNYVIPQLFILANIAIFILMLINRMAWREYMIYQIVMTVIGLIPLILILRNIVTRPLTSYVCIVISIVILVGTIIFRDKSVKDELIRRFHI